MDRAGEIEPGRAVIVVANCEHRLCPVLTTQQRQQLLATGGRCWPTAAPCEGLQWVGSGRLSTYAPGRQQPRNNHITVVMFLARRAERVAQASMSLSAFRGLQARRVKPILIGLT